MTSDYVFRLLVMLPLVLALIVGGLWVAKRVMAMPKGPRQGGGTRVSETVFLTPGNRLAVVEFGGKRLLLAVTKSGVSLISQADSFQLLVENGNA